MMKKVTKAFMLFFLLSGCNYISQSNSEDIRGSDIVDSNNGVSSENIPVTHDVTFYLSNSEESGKYTLTLITENKNTELNRLTFENYRESIIFADDVNLEGISYDSYSMNINKVYISDGITKISDFSLINHLSDFDLYIGKDVKSVDNYAFDYELNSYATITMSSFDIYFEGDLPTANGDNAYKFSYFHIVNFYYYDGAKGFDKEYDFNHYITFKKIGESLVLPSCTVNEYAEMTHQEAYKLSDKIFKETIENNMVGNMLFPIAEKNFYRTIKDFTIDLTKNCNTELEKTRVIFNWIVENIEYSDLAITYSCKEVFTKKKAVCAGYVILMHDMLSSVGIMSQYTRGICNLTKDLALIDIFVNNNKEIGENHAWLAAYVDGETKFFDPTWNVFDFDSALVFGDYRITQNAGIFTVVPEGVDYKLFDSCVIYYEDEIRAFAFHGSVRRLNGYGTFYNMVYQVEIRFHAANDGLKYIGNYPPVEGAAYRGGAALYSGEYVDYYLTNGMRFQYIDMLMYVLIDNKTYDSHLTIPGLEDYVIENDMLFKVINDNELSLIACYNENEEIIIPSYVDGKKVTIIDYSSFNGIDTLKKVVIPGTVKIIKQAVFSGCVNLEEIIIEEGVEEIQNGAFEYCKISMITLPDSLISIGSCFVECLNLNEVNIGKNLMEITSPFVNCKNLRAINVNEENKYLCSIDGVLYDEEKTKIINYPMAKDGVFFEVIEGVKTIEINAFQYSKLEYISLPESLENLNLHAFSFSNLKEVTVPSNVKFIDQYAFAWCRNLEIVNLECAIDNINISTFTNCISLEEIYFKEGLKKIDNSSFSHCVSLKKVGLPKSLERINFASFDQCSNLEIIEYRGTEYDKNRISIEGNNENLLNATWKYV